MARWNFMNWKKWLIISFRILDLVRAILSRFLTFQNKKREVNLGCKRFRKIILKLRFWDHWTAWFFEWLLWQYLVHSSIQHHKTCQKAQIWNFSQLLSNQIVTEKSDFCEKSIWKLIARVTAAACWIKIENGFKYFHTYGHLFQRLT